jgi:hypothetical protein
MGRLKTHFSVAARELDAAERVRRHEQVVQAAFAGAPGVPDSAAWNVKMQPGEEGAQAKYTYRHAGLQAGRPFTNLALLARALAELVHAGAAIGKLGSSGGPSSPGATEPPVEYDGTRALVQVQQAMSSGGAWVKLMPLDLTLVRDAASRRCLASVLTRSRRRPRSLRPKAG